MEREEMEKQKELLQDRQEGLQERLRLRRHEQEEAYGSLRNNYYNQDEGRPGKTGLTADFLEEEDDGYVRKGPNSTRRDLDRDEDRIREAKRSAPNPGKRLRQQFEDDEDDGEDDQVRFSMYSISLFRFES